MELLTTVYPLESDPLSIKQIRKEPWLTASLKISIDRNKKQYAKMLQHEYSPEKYKEYNNTLHKTLRQAKKKFYMDMCHEYKCQTKKLWGLINEISGKKNYKTGLIEYLRINGVKEYNSEKISNRFANYFASVGKNFASKIASPKKSISDYLKLLQSSQNSLFSGPYQYS